MAIDEARARKLLRDFNFPGLFVEELGWDKHKATLSIPIDNRTFELSAVAEKRVLTGWGEPHQTKHPPADAGERCETDLAARAAGDPPECAPYETERLLALYQGLPPEFSALFALLLHFVFPSPNRLHAGKERGKAEAGYRRPY